MLRSLVFLALLIVRAPGVCAAPESPAARLSRYLYALERFLPAERERMLAWLAAARLRAPAASLLPALVRGRTVPATFHARLAGLRSLLARMPDRRAIVAHLLLERSVNPVQAGRRLDRCIDHLASGWTPAVEHVRAALPALMPRDPGKVPLFPNRDRDELLSSAREKLRRGSTAWEAELAQVIDDVGEGFRFNERLALGYAGEALLMRDRSPDDVACAQVLLAVAHERGGGEDTMRGRALAGCAAGLAGQLPERRRYLELALARRPIEPEVHLWCALAEAADGSPGAVERFEAHLNALATFHHEPELLEELMRAAPLLDVVERGSDLALGMIAQGGRLSPSPALADSWTAAIELDAAPLIALVLAARGAVPLDRANLLLPGDEHSIRASLDALTAHARIEEKNLLTTLVVWR